MHGIMVKNKSVNNMNRLKHLTAIFLMVNIYSCSNNEVKQDEAKTIDKPMVDTTNILLANVCQNKLWGFVNTDLKTVINPQFENAMPFNEGLACVETNKKWGFINIKGEFVIRPSFDGPGVFHDGLAKVGTKTSVGSLHYLYINHNGENIFNTEYNFGTDFNNGTAEVKNNDGRTLYIDLKGNIVTQPNVAVYNHFKYSKHPYGGELHKSIELDPITGKPIGIKYNPSNYGYQEESGYHLTEAIFCFAGEFTYSYKTPAQYFSTTKNDSILSINLKDTTVSSPIPDSTRIETVD